MPATAVIREGSGVFGQFQKPVPLVETKPACRNRVIRDFGFQKYGPVQVLPNPVQDMLADLVVALFGVDGNKMNVVAIPQVPIDEQTRQFALFVDGVEVHRPFVIDHVRHQRRIAKPFVLGKGFPMQCDKFFRIRGAAVRDSFQFHNS